MLAASRNRVSICSLLLDAGADPELKNQSGQTATQIAMAAGAFQAVNVLATAIEARRQLHQCNEISAGVTDNGSAEALPAKEPVCSGNLVGEAPAAYIPDLAKAIQEPVPEKNCTDTEVLPIQDFSSEAGDTGTTPSFTDEPASRFLPQADETAIVEKDSILDLSGWEVEETFSPPENNEAVFKAAAEAQRSLSRHVPVDQLEDWSDIEAFLPTQAVPLVRAEDADTQADLRLLFLQASKEGRVPRQTLRRCAVDDEGLFNEQLECHLLQVIHDLGAETDEFLDGAFPYTAADASETDEQEVEMAIAAFRDLASYRNDPFRLYMKEIQQANRQLLSPEEELALSRAMEEALARAIESLALWPEGLNRLFHAVDLIRKGRLPFTKVFSSKSPDDEPVDQSTEPEAGSSDMETEEETDAPAPSGSAPEFQVTALLEQLDALQRPGQDGCSIGDTREVQAVLANLGLSRTFLVELADSAFEKAAGHAGAAGYATAIQSYLDARERMVNCNLRLVLTIARWYAGKEIPFDDLVQEGNLGLIKAVERFDWRRGFRFSTMATWWIRQSITRSIPDATRAVRLPIHVHDSVLKVARAAKALEMELGRKPLPAEISEATGLPASKIRRFIGLADEAVSIDEMSHAEMVDRGLTEHLVESDPFESLSTKQLHETLEQVLSDIGRRPTQIIRMRYGIGIREILTLEEVGSRMGVTRERIRQIEVKGLRLLKHPARLTILSPWAAVPPGPRKSQTTETEATPSDNSQEELQSHEVVPGLELPLPV